MGKYSIPQFHSCGLVLQLGKRVGRCHATCLSAGRDTFCDWVGDGDHDSFLLWAALVWIFAVSVFLLARDNVHHGHDSTIFVNFELINFILKCRLA
jgi:hypothetical protein